MEKIEKLFEGGAKPTLGQILGAIGNHSPKRVSIKRTDPHGKRVRALMDVANGRTTDLPTEADTYAMNSKVAVTLGLTSAARYLRTAAKDIGDTDGGHAQEAQQENE